MSVINRDKFEALLISIIFLISLFVRLHFLLVSFWPDHDEGVYATIAFNILHGNGNQLMGSFFIEHSPLVPFFAAVVSFFTGLEPLFAGRLLSLFYSMAAVVLVYLVSRRLFNSEIAVMSTALYSFFGYFLFFSTFFILDIALNFFSLLALFILVYYDLRKFYLLSFVVAICPLIRELGYLTLFAVSFYLLINLLKKQISFKKFLSFFIIPLLFIFSLSFLVYYEGNLVDEYGYLNESNKISFLETFIPVLRESSAEFVSNWLEFPSYKNKILSRPFATLEELVWAIFFQIIPIYLFVFSLTEFRIIHPIILSLRAIIPAFFVYFNLYLFTTKLYQNKTVQIFCLFGFFYLVGLIFFPETQVWYRIILFPFFAVMIAIGLYGFYKSKYLRPIVIALIIIVSISSFIHVNSIFVNQEAKNMLIFKAYPLTEFLYNTRGNVMVLYHSSPFGRNEYLYLMMTKDEEPKIKFYPFPLRKEDLENYIKEKKIDYVLIQKNYWAQDVIDWFDSRYERVLEGDIVWKVT